jgi:hypothetical protein
MRVLSGLCLCLFSLYIWQTNAVGFATWTLLENAGSGFATNNWQCTASSGFDCTSYPTPNAAQTAGGASSKVVLPSCESATQTTLDYTTGGSNGALMWPPVDETNFCYSLYISGPYSTFSSLSATGPLPSLYFFSGSNDVSVEQKEFDMTIPVLDVDNSKVVTVAAVNIKLMDFALTRATTVVFKKLLATSTATNSVELQNTTITFAPSIGVLSVWNVNCASGISFTENFSISSAASDYQLSVYNQANAGTLIIISAQTLSVSDGKLNLNSVTSGGNSTISGTAVTLRNSSATLNLVGLWSISSLASFSGAGTLDLSSALPANGFVLPSTHTGHTIKVAASSTLVATGNFNQVTLSSTGAFTVDRSNAEGVMDIKAITAVTSVTLKNGRFRLGTTSVAIFLQSAELTVVGGSGQQISADADSTVIFDSSTAQKTPPVNSDGDVRVWNYEYALYGELRAAKGIFVEKKSYAFRFGLLLPDATTVDDATFSIRDTFAFGVPIIIQNNGVLSFDFGAVLDVNFTNVSLLSGGKVINNIDFTPLVDVAFGTKGSNQGEFLSYGAIVVGNITFTTDKLVLKENASLIIEADGVVSASSLYVAPSTWVDFMGSIQLSGDFVNDGEVYWGGKETVGNSALTGHYAQNANGTTFLTVTSLNDAQPVGEYDSLTVTGDVYLFGTLNLEFADPEAALALPDQAWYPFITLTGFSGGVFDMIEHNLGAEVTINVCFTETQGILVFHHNTTTSVVEFEELPENCDFVNAVPLSPGTEPLPEPSTISSAFTFAVSYIILLAAVLLQIVC